MNNMTGTVWLCFTLIHECNNLLHLYLNFRRQNVELCGDVNVNMWRYVEMWRPNTEVWHSHVEMCEGGVHPHLGICKDMDTNCRMCWDQRWRYVEVWSHAHVGICGGVESTCRDMTCVQLWWLVDQTSMLRWRCPHIKICGDQIWRSVIYMWRYFEVLSQHVRLCEYVDTDCGGLHVEIWGGVETKCGGVETKCADMWRCGDQMWRYVEVWRPNVQICGDQMWRYVEVWRPNVEIYVEVWRPNEELAYIVQNGKNDRSYLLVTTPKFVWLPIVAYYMIPWSK